MPRGRMQRSLSLPAHDWLPVKKSLSLPPYDWLGECWGPCPAAPIDREDMYRKGPPRPVVVLSFAFCLPPHGTSWQLPRCRLSLKTSSAQLQPIHSIRPGPATHVLRMVASLHAPAYAQ